MKLNSEHKLETILFVIGSTHRTAPLEVRERIALDQEKFDLLYNRLLLGEHLEECLILNTCNRVEIYGVTRDTGFKDHLSKLISEIHHMDPHSLEPFLFCKRNYEVAEHLFNVSAGVDSQMVGETEIFGQIKQSYAIARDKQAVGPVLNRLFQRSFKEAKWARTHTGISRGQVSIGNVTVDLAQRIFGDLEKCSLLVLGSGDVSEKTVQAFQSRGTNRITITSRSFDNAIALADQFGGTALHFNHFQRHLHEYDIVVSSTRSPGAILSRKRIASVIAARPSHPLFLIDLAIPRDIDPQSGKLNNVFLYNLDDLAEIANENLESRMKEVDSVKTSFSKKAWQVWLNILRRQAITNSRESKTEKP